MSSGRGLEDWVDELVQCRLVSRSATRSARLSATLVSDFQCVLLGILVMYHVEIICQEKSLFFLFFSPIVHQDTGVGISTVPLPETITSGLLVRG